MRFFVLQFNELDKKDIFSGRDPYIKILVNEKEIINKRKNYQEDEKDCLRYKHPQEITGSSSLKIEEWDWDEIFSDNLIGNTIIDLEDWFLNEDWQNMEYKPMESSSIITSLYWRTKGKVLK